MRAFGRMILVGSALAGSACVPKPQPAPEPTPPAPTPSPAPAPPPAPAPRDWADLPLTPGDWRYGVEGDTPKATYGSAGGSQFSLECDRAGRRVSLVRAGATSGALTVRTSYGARALPASARGMSLAATLSASDPLLDQIAFSRGRFTVEVPGAAQIVLPAWPETARVVEECRL